MSDDVPSAVPGPPLPDRLGQRFALGELIGRGTCSEVYRAHDLLLDRDAAVKIFPVENDPRIEREVALMASLDHPSLVPVFDVGHVAGRAFVVMSLLGGGNLSDRLADGPMGVTETLLAVASVADGLGHVHRAGVLHRDVTPRNVLFDDDGRAHLSDFGVAFVADAPRITDTGIVVGSAPYLAPEQVRGETVGPPADVYALGLVMIEALTARPAYDGKPLAAARARLERRPDIPDGLDIEVVALLDAMTADDPAHRPTAEQVCVGLRRAALAAETLTPLRAVAPLAGPGIASAVPDATTETLRPGGPVPAAGAAAAAPVGVPGVAAGSLGMPGADPGTAETPRTPERTRRPWAVDAGGFAVAASVAAAVLLAGGVVVASAWTGDGGSSVAAPAATVPPPTAEVVTDPGGGGTFAGGPVGRPARDSDEDAPVTRERRSASTDADEETRRAIATTDGGSTSATPSEEPSSSAPTSTSRSTPSSTTSSSTTPSSSTPTSTTPSSSTPTSTSPQGLLPGLPGVTLPDLPTRSSTEEPTATRPVTRPATPSPSTARPTTTHATSTPATTSSAAPTTTTSADSTTTPEEDGTADETADETAEAADATAAADTATTAPTTTTTPRRAALVDPTIEALGGLLGGR
ncbi:serine/threonine-protein kinase [Actinomycetospora straminea]|uniref:non-specific serine/threonine protein kinase n=1 Tax=Actinomycetospora straminea TaxID=663607 RepID=A0ABP9EG93_9PSEU|nr:serine/threonine-protein kinase [Actinomycetospora straminea]MDD7936383.1 serine/threonine-protein kinase [Actinomycetospora straminea]